ncbi:hypothetical protein [Algoriphagus sp. A40]|uniref:hypothetical protein n=1 Tax=Algoriphagus sp. A40 TaxID=1945863 RepID=UPI0009873EB6|nr:hypothetical protein [Algoriphagus sp. A40]OOG73784.1 hypothetical protein B0E43_13145 [Algoriphagus sp. A40]
MKAAEKLKEAVEERLGRGPSGEWNNYDFERLSEEILSVTSVSLSVSTLKRFFGKVKYGSSPSLTTLNALSEFAGFADWRHFESSTVKSDYKETPPDKKPSILIPMKARQLRGYLYSGISLLLIVLVFFYWKSMPSYDSADFSFSSKTVLTRGLPNSVIFDYEASRIKDSDSAFISQSWDIRRKFAIDKNARHHSSIYYYPGYFRAKLMAGEQVLKEHDIQITSDGWLGVVTAPWGERPLYFSKAEITTAGSIEVSEDLLLRYKVSLHPDLPEIRLFNQDNLKGFYTDNFEFETEVKSGFSAGKAACQRMEILLQAKNDILILPLSRPECVGDLFLAAFGVGVGSQEEDLSGFGSELNEWVKIKVTCLDRQIRFFVNDKLAYQTRITNPVTEIVGVQYRFEGPGGVRNTRLISGEKVWAAH